jgi:hypothetical protein
VLPDKDNVVDTPTQTVPVTDDTVVPAVKEATVVAVKEVVTVVPFVNPAIVPVPPVRVILTAVLAAVALT